MPRPRRGEQLNVRVPPFAKQHLDTLPARVLATGEKRPSQPEIVAALVATVTVRTLSQALKAYRKELRRRGLADFHR